MTTFRKYQCWKPERISKVIAKAALDVDRATFLATHVPMRDIVYEKSPLEIPRTGEQDFLEELNRMAREDTHVFTVIKGIPGTGKSHLIRWIYERYRQNHPNDRVLLIERANTSLKKTIQQIIESGFFESAALSEQLKRLKNAADSLSREGLADTLLGHLGVATTEIEWEEKLHQRIAKEKIYLFLLDKTVREHLKREGGPIDRVVRYLQEGHGIERSEIPEFESDDFLMSPQQRGKLHEAYTDVRNVVEDINRENPKQREQLTRYLNYLLKTYAISRTTNLAAADLREMFNELRRTLRVQRQSLALFIEDITAFTGIDAGLIDVLITQHTGGDNKDFCRLTSVIGITDAYFSDSFPANVRERITYQLTLSTQGGRGESDMLQNETALSEFVAHYLNAIRVDTIALERWEQEDAPQSGIPNACTNCLYRIVCHAAFGAVNIASKESITPQMVGLYPFNSTSVVRMYNNLESNVARTPRALLDNILSYILQSHGDKVARGKFPPSADMLAPKVGLQEFDPPAHGRIIEQQGKDDVERLKTLFLFWGNRNVIHTGDFIGGLNEDVFTAFDILKIDGRISEIDPRSVSKAMPSEVIIETRFNEKTIQPQKIVNRQSDFSEDISRWFAEGYLPSQVANRLLQLLTGAILGIDWQSYNIPPTKIPTPNQASSYFALEGQAARIEQNKLTFRRSSELRYALEAVANFNDKEILLEPDQYGEYLTTLDAWLRQEEQNIVDFVRVRVQQNLPYELVPRLLIQEAVLIACLVGGLSNVSSVTDLYQQVITACSGLQDTHRKRIEGLKNSYSPAWNLLIEDLLKANAGPIVLEATLRQFSAPQGDAKELRFLHAGPMIQTLSEFEASAWELETLQDGLPSDTGQQEWDSLIRVHKTLQSQFPKAINEAFDELSKIREKIAIHISNGDIKLIFSEMHDLLRDIASSHPVDPSLRSELHSLNPDELQRLIKETSAVMSTDSVIQKAIFLSQGYAKYIVTLRRYTNYFDRFATSMDAVQRKLSENRSSLKEIQEATELISLTTQKYDALLHRLDEILTTKDQ